MKIAIMQPYFLPYIGYWQLINCVNKIVIYDNVKYTKKGWINRNRLLLSEKSTYFTIPLKKGSDYLDIKDREVSKRWKLDRIKILNKINVNYKKSPNFNVVYSLVESIFFYEESNLYKFLAYSIKKISKFLDIKTTIIKSSEINIRHDLKLTRKILAICKELNANIYVNPYGGKSLYNKGHFKDNQIDLLFLRSNKIEYDQFGKGFEPSLSIIDVLMFNNIKAVKSYLNKYQLI